MTPERLFALSTNVAMLSWLLLIAAPRWKWASGLITSVVVPALMGGLYVWLVIPRIPELINGFGSVSGISRVFQDGHVVVAGWLHYLAFDLFIGSWQVRDARRLGIGHLWILPSLVLTLFFGPAGLLLYLVTRAGLRRRLGIGWEAPDARAAR